jgi:AdoMet-dependent heme synthase
MELADQPEEHLPAPPGRRLDGRRDGLIDLELSAGLAEELAEAAAEEGVEGTADAPPEVALRSLDTLWFQVGGTLCNLACTHCFISCSPTNHTHEMMRLEQVRRYLREAVELGVKEFYFTGGEPFLNPEMEAILAATLAVGPASVLTNGLLLDAARCARLAALAAASPYSLDLRVSLDGFDAASNDAVRGAGTFERVLAGLRNLAAAGLNPVVTVTEVCAEAAVDSGKRRFFALLGGLGLTRPRLKVLPVFKIGAEAKRAGGYESWQRLRGGELPLGAPEAIAAPASPDAPRPPDAPSASFAPGVTLASAAPPLSAVPAAETARWDHLQCSSCRMVTDQGVWVCPILVNEPAARMGETLADALGPYPLRHAACWTCHVYGVSCRT